MPPPYRNCGFLGFGAPAATEKDFASSGYQPDTFKASCGFLGFGQRAATLSDIPQPWLDACTPASGTRSPGTEYTVSSPGVCSAVAPPPSAPPPTCASGTVLPSPFGVTALNSAACPTGYDRISKADRCLAAATAFKLPHRTNSSSGQIQTIANTSILNGCVVHGTPGTTALNTRGANSAFGGDQFLLCQRSPDNEACVKIGSTCGDKESWSKDGRCREDPSMASTATSLANTVSTVAGTLSDFQGLL